MENNFDQQIDRRHSDSVKWNNASADVLPMWVADMDFLSPKSVIEQLQARASHGVFGYPNHADGLIEAIQQHLQSHFHWQVAAEEIVFMPGVVPALNLACRAFANPKDGIMFHTPVYGPFFALAKNGGFEQQDIQLTRHEHEYYDIDYQEFTAAIKPNTRMYVLCNPHNPVGRVYRRDELEKIAEICLQNNLLICSDEIHADLVFSGHHHIPIAALDKEIANHTVTLMAPSKTFNIAGLDCAFAVIPNPELRKQYQQAQQGFFGHINLFGQLAAEAAYREGQTWLKEMLVYLEGNRDFMVQFIQHELPEIPVSIPEGTYLAWLDCRAMPFADNPAEFFLNDAKVQVNDGLFFGPVGKGYVRLNFGCPRSFLEEGLSRIKRSIH